jgi:hypothetical protein
VGESPAGQGASPTPRADLAGQAEVAAENLAKAAQGKGHERRGRKEGTADRGRDAKPRSGSVERHGSDGSGDPVAAASWTPLRTVADGRGDQGAGPAYADLVAMRLADDGQNLRVTLDLAGTVPGLLADREVQGVGLDLFRTSAEESDFQVYLDGGAHGWRGFLQTPRGFVRYPGTLTVRGGTLTTVLPWRSLGGRAEAQVSAFTDWADGSGRSGSDTVDRGPMQVR